MAVTPDVRRVLDDFLKLSSDNQRKFLDVFGKLITAEVIWRLAAAMDFGERIRFADTVFEKLSWQAFPFFIKEAVKVARGHPNLSEPDLIEMVERNANESMRIYNETMREVESARLKKKRDRKSDEKIILRNVEICDLRKKDPKHWSLKRLAKRFGFKTERNVTKIVSEESKWRLLAAQIGTK